MSTFWLDFCVVVIDYKCDLLGDKIKEVPKNTPKINVSFSIRFWVVVIDYKCDLFGDKINRVPKNTPKNTPKINVSFSIRYLSYCNENKKSTLSPEQSHEHIY